MDPDCAAAFCMSHHEKPGFAGNAEGQHTFLVRRMIWVQECKRKRITKYGGSLLKGYFMLCDIGRSLCFIPFKFEHCQVPRCYA